MDSGYFSTALGGSVGLSKILPFLQFCGLAKSVIQWSSKGETSTPPDDLPINIVSLLGRLLNEDHATIEALWSALKNDVWSYSCGQSASPEFVKQFNKEALPLGTSYRHVFPPTRVCLTPSCSNHRTVDQSDAMTLTHPITHPASLFTLREGSLPVYATSLYCRGCHKRYYHNYWVHKDSSSWFYYSGVPESIQVSTHYFIDAPLLEFYATGCTFGWLSSMNAARIYNLSMAQNDSHVTNNSQAYSHSRRLGAGWRSDAESGWGCSRELGEEYLLNGFFLYSLLLEKAEQSSTLFLPHDEQSQKHRLQEALSERNKKMEGPGQEAYLHACDLCFSVFDGEDGKRYKVQAVVCDGDSIGFPCCAVHDCKEPLITLRDRFCHTHSNLKDQCAVTTCHEPHEVGFRTCSNIQHRALEVSYFDKGKALMQLRARLKKAYARVEDDPSLSVGSNHGSQAGLGDEEDGEAVLVETVDTCTGKPEAGNCTLKAYFGRRRTHNEQLFVRPCGVIVSRATMYGSEAVSGVNEFAKATFPTPESTPEFLIFDNNCRLDLHQRAIGETHFKDTAQPVDVFHFKSKHKITDTHCQLHCNPAAFPELVKDGKWRFNSSICEQVNTWLGKFQAILRDMDSVRYTFFLDEMIKRKNRYTIQELGRKGSTPWTIPVHAVFPTLFT